jgi:hypothetical protein
LGYEPLVDRIVLVVELLSPQGLAQNDKKRRHLVEGKRREVVPIQSRIERLLERAVLLVR